MPCIVEMTLAPVSRTVLIAIAGSPMWRMRADGSL